MEVDEKTDHESSRDSTPALPETLIAGRQRRSTAGNRLAQLLEQEQPDDIDLLFEENGEEDDDFVGKDESDIDLGSSSDEEDKPQEQDELAGEKELQQQERAAKKKRKAADAFPGQKQLDKLVQRQQNLRNKRVTIQEPNQSKEGSPQTVTGDEQALRPRKKSERISWIPTQEDQPSRQSSRRQTVANKQMIHERMKESNERRLKVIAAMNEASQKKKEQHVEMTQEMRLARAKKVEEQNKKSLNKWQVAEEARLEAQRAKLAALHNRKIEGPIIRFYSGRAEWDENDQLSSLGKRKLVKEKPVQPSTEDKKPKTNEAVEVENTIVNDPEPTEDVVMQDVPSNAPDTATETEAAHEPAAKASVDGDQSVPEAPLEVHLEAPVEAPVEASIEAPLEAQSEAPLTALPVASPTASPTVLVPAPVAAPLEIPSEPQIERISVAPPSPGGEDDDTQNQIAEQLQGDLDAALRPSEPRVASQTYIVLQNFKKDAVSNKEVQGKILFPHNHGPLPRPERLLCVTTSLPARFKDPATGLPYASLFGYKQIQRVKNGDLRWNNELQCFFDGQEAASGVPEGFYL
ncbi:hypothetical protein ABW19_dt0207176 [Dactylella cylindrospora]|nr:hypothetical protein ABW19_dt0207176 [Dactylella cylindrospora]